MDKSVTVSEVKFVTAYEVINTTTCWMGDVRSPITGRNDVQNPTQPGERTFFSTIL